MTSPSPAPLTEAEQAAAEVLSHFHNFRAEIGFELEADDFADEARAVVAAVEPIIAKKLVESADLVYQFAQSRPVTSAEARAIFDGIATALSLPASKETPDA